MSIRFYTTSVPVERSLSEVIGLLRKYGAQRFEQIWNDDGSTRAVRFNLYVPEVDDHMAVRLEPRTDLLAEALLEEHGIDEPDQVDRVAWRQMKGVLEGVLLACEHHMFSPAEVFMGMAERPDGQTMWTAFVEAGGPMGLLGPGESR